MTVIEILTNPRFQAELEAMSLDELMAARNVFTMGRRMIRTSPEEAEARRSLFVEELVLRGLDRDLVESDELLEVGR